MGTVKEHRKIFSVDSFTGFFSTFLHVTFLQVMAVPLICAKNSLGLERSALIETSPSSTLHKLGNRFTMSWGLFCSQTLEPSKLKDMLSPSSGLWKYICRFLSFTNHCRCTEKQTLAFKSTYTYFLSHAPCFKHLITLLFQDG